VTDRTQREKREDASDQGGVLPVRAWQQRLDNPDEPLYTVGVAADLLGVDAQTIRRLQGAAVQASARPSGNQRRYSRRDLEILASAAELSKDGINTAAIGRIIELERRVQRTPDQ